MFHKRSALSILFLATLLSFSASSSVQLSITVTEGFSNYLELTERLVYLVQGPSAGIPPPGWNGSFFEYNALWLSRLVSALEDHGLIVYAYPRHTTTIPEINDELVEANKPLIIRMEIERIEEERGIDLDPSNLPEDVRREIEEALERARISVGVVAMDFDSIPPELLPVLLEGSYPAGKRECLVSLSISRAAGVGLGDSLTLELPTKIIEGGRFAKFRIERVGCRVSGIFIYLPLSNGHLTDPTMELSVLVDRGLFHEVYGDNLTEEAPYLLRSFAVLLPSPDREIIAKANTDPDLRELGVFLAPYPKRGMSEVRWKVSILITSFMLLAILSTLILPPILIFTILRAMRTELTTLTVLGRRWRVVRDSMLLNHSAAIMAGGIIGAFLSVFALPLLRKFVVSNVTLVVRDVVPLNPLAVASALLAVLTILATEALLLVRMGERRPANALR